MSDCAHKTIADHSKVSGVGSRFWTCSDCGLVAVWGPRWAYHGVAECRVCGWAVVDRVSCGCQPIGKSLDS